MHTIQCDNVWLIPEDISKLTFFTSLNFKVSMCILEKYFDLGLENGQK